MDAVSEVRQANGYDVDAASRATGLECLDDSLAVQSQKEEADINVIVRRFGVTGMLPVIQVPEALTGDVEEFDLMTANAVLIEARQSFLSLDADVRARFNNDPMRFVAFAIDEKNIEELRKLGLAKPIVAPEPERVQKVEIVNERGEGFRDVASDAAAAVGASDGAARRNRGSARRGGVDD